MPTAWPTRYLVKGQIDESLHFAGGAASYRWWTTHNTYNQQFDVEPARLLPDLLAEVPAQGPATLGQSFAMQVTVKNEGGLPASGVTVQLFEEGQLLGTATAAGPLAVRGGAQTVSIAWTPAVEGRHTLCARVNPAGAIEESGAENNEDCATVFVRAPAAGCDLVVEAPAAFPAAAAPGDVLTLHATLRNAGTTPCLASVLEVTDGPASNSVFLGAAPVPLLTPGATFLASVSAVAQPGTHPVRFTADVASSSLDVDTSNNVVVLQVAVGAATLPDLWVSSLELAPQPVFPFETLTATAVVRNGGAPAPASQVRIGGIDVEVPPLPGGADVALVVTLPSPAPALVTASVDPQGLVPEFDEANNALTVPVLQASPQLLASAAASPSSAGPDTAVGLDVTLLNSSTSARELSVSAEVATASGATVASIAGATRVLAGPGTTAFTLPWNTGRLPPAGYLLVVRAHEAGRLMAEAQAPFTVLSELATSAAVAVDRGTYAPRETVVILGRVENASRNTPSSGAVATVSLSDPLGVVVQSSTRPAPLLPPLGHFDFSDAHRLSPMARAGTYQLTHEVRDSNGILLASASTTFQVAVVPALNITAVTTVAPVFAVTPPLPVRVELTNTSSAGLQSGALSVELFDIAGAMLLAPESTAARAVSVPVGTTRIEDFLLPTTGIAVGPKLLVVRLDGVILQRLRVEAVAPTDNEPPVIEVAGVFDLEVTRFDVTPVITVVDASAFTSAATLDGAPFVSGTAVTAAGAHVLEVAATDVFGNSAFKAIRFTIDKTAPSLTLHGPADGSFLNAPVTLPWTVSDATAVTVEATLNGLPLQSGDTVSAEGVYVWQVTATDAAGNVTSESRQFALDFTGPLIDISGVGDGEHRNVPLELSFTVTDASPVVVLATLDGAPFQSGDTVSTEDSHTLTVSATDAAGNVTTRSVSFTLDFTPPLLTVSGVAAGGVYASPRTITFSAADASPVTVTATLDASPFASGDTAATEGAHLLVVTATDAAGNSTQRTVSFTIDTSPPHILISGVTEGATGPSFTPVVAVTDATATSVVTTLDGAEFVSGTTVTAPGAHTLFVLATDAAGNSATATVHFTVVAGPREPVFQFGACATGNLTMRNSAQTTGGVAANGSMTLENAALVLGDVVAGGNLTLRNSARVTGRGRYGGALSIANAPAVQGGASQAAPAPSPCQCSYDVGAELNAAAQTNDNASIAGLLNAQGALELTNAASATLPGGTYYLSSLRLRNASRLKVAVGQSARLFVRHSVHVENASTLGGMPPQSGSMLVVSGADATDGGVVELENASEASLRVYAPRADVRLQNAARLTGGVVGRSLTLQNSHRLTSDAVTDGGIPLSCP